MLRKGCVYFHSWLDCLPRVKMALNFVGDYFFFFLFPFPFSLFLDDAQHLTSTDIIHGIKRQPLVDC